MMTLPNPSALEGKPCCYCGSAMTRTGKPRQANYATKDHVIPRCAGGRGRRTVRCCRLCNEDKAHLSIAEYRAVLSVRNRVPHVFYFERLAAYVLWRHVAEWARRALVTVFS